MLDFDQREGPRTEERLALGRRAREVCERMAAVYPTLIVFRANKAWIDGIMAEILIDLDRDAEALPLLEEARSIRTDLIRSDPETLRFQETLSLILLDLRAVHARTGRFAEARAARAMALEIQARLARRNPDNPTMLNEQASWLTNTSDKIRRVDRSADAVLRAEEAGEGYRQAVAIRERLVEQHPDARTTAATWPTASAGSPWSSATWAMPPPRPQGRPGPPRSLKGSRLEKPVLAAADRTRGRFRGFLRADCLIPERPTRPRPGPEARRGLSAAIDRCP